MRGARSCMQTCPPMQTVIAVMRAAQGLWGLKAITILQEITGRSERTVRYWRARRRNLSSDELATLIRSEDGLTFLSAVMADSEPRWWMAFKQQVAIKDARRYERAARRKLQEAIDADADLTAAIERADALLVSDPDFYRPNADAQRAIARVPHRAVAAGSKRR